MDKNKLKVMLSFMREINDGNIPEAKDHDMGNSEFWDIIEACQDEGLIKGAKCARGGTKCILYLENTKLTVKGLEYLNDKSILMKTYRGLKEIKEWILFK